MGQRAPTFGGKMETLLNLPRQLSSQEVNAMIRKLGTDEKSALRILPGGHPPKSMSGCIIRVNRSMRPAYPSNMVDLMDPEMERKGPSKFDMAQVEPWFHESQKDAGMKGIDV